MTELNLNNNKIEMMGEDGEAIKEVIATADIVTAMMRECFDLNERKKVIEAELKEKRSDLQPLLEGLTITKITTDDFTMTHVPGNRFSGWKDEKSLLELIPEYLRGIETMNPDRTKIETLVKDEIIPEEALELRHFKPNPSIRFTPTPSEKKGKTD